ncbi:L-seryl-tRNA(Sec) selenium transferase [Andreesenia angusta]|uniref:L-seryl-tRNA(Sec) selenium transferase n=1 Tax=Andreesenia angusta TaxID=39480 RepID=A0A1S1V7I5_9FIRM|nr:L-seryl-tRNA(Sec) selenium transferase [Andreesenia angusta]OHW62522.1 L-seryl-tRNA(Sec) selenium transferase [Andreesenia angusta]
MGENIYSKIPKVDAVLEIEDIKKLIEKTSRNLVMESIREELDGIRKSISKTTDMESLERRIAALSDSIVSRTEGKFENKFKRTVNATGVVIHTNLGRSLISKEVMDNVYDLATNYSNLEFDLETGERGSRYSHLVDMIKRITGAEDALVVNNNAAAVVLVLSAMAKGKEVITSRGELVEIGGSFRIPEVMEQSGATLVDVGATNKTHIEDYRRAVTENTGALLKVHTSNYRIVGFTESLSLEEIVALGNEASIPVIEDLGSGVLIDFSKYGLEYEPTVQDSVDAGVDVITFSGDKLLGGPQAGIIVGKSEYIKIMKKHPLNRAFRIDKFTIAALEGTMKMYLSEERAVSNIPTLKLLTQDIGEIESRAKALMEKVDGIDAHGVKVEIVDEYSQVGGGSMPLERIPTKALKLNSESLNIGKLEKGLRQLETPIITRLYKDSIYMDMRTVRDDEVDLISRGLEKAIERL